MVIYTVGGAASSLKGDFKGEIKSHRPVIIVVYF